MIALLIALSIKFERIDYMIHAHSKMFYSLRYKGENRR